MAIAERDIKLLWGRAAGRCSQPECNEDLTVVLEQGGYVIGEMAHVIGRRPTATRGVPSGGADTYDNLILLCPNHHTHIDKAPEGTFPESVLHEWKRNHEKNIRSNGERIRFTTFTELSREICQLLLENKIAIDTFGPNSATATRDPSSNLIDVWLLRRLDTILPNNTRISNILKGNANIIPDSAAIASARFRAHAAAYQQHLYTPLDSYPTYPSEFTKVFACNE